MKSTLVENENNFRSCHGHMKAQYTRVHKRRINYYIEVTSRNGNNYTPSWT